MSDGVHYLMKTLILGLGNTLLGDEGVGVHVVRRLRGQQVQNNEIELLDGGTLSFTLAGVIEAVDQLVVIDAARINGTPGGIHLYEGEEMDRFIAARQKSSVHEVSLLDLLTIARLTDRLPRRRALIGIEPELVDWSDSLSRRVEQAVPRACDVARQLIKRWRQ